MHGCDVLNKRGFAAIGAHPSMLCCEQNHFWFVTSKVVLVTSAQNMHAVH